MGGPWRDRQFDGMAWTSGPRVAAGRSASPSRWALPAALQAGQYNRERCQHERDVTEYEGAARSNCGGGEPLVWTFKERPIGPGHQRELRRKLRVMKGLADILPAYATGEMCLSKYTGSRLYPTHDDIAQRLPSV
jgi:hypothetical protein